MRGGRLSTAAPHLAVAPAAVDDFDRPGQVPEPRARVDQCRVDQCAAIANGHSIRAEERGRIPELGPLVACVAAGVVCAERPTTWGNKSP